MIARPDLGTSLLGTSLLYFALGAFVGSALVKLYVTWRWRR